jgi:hypothetical protein
MFYDIYILDPLLFLDHRIYLNSGNGIAVNVVSVLRLVCMF